ncbi:MAG: glycosyltransferase family 2 protein [Candidatus Paceibacterota bacterium]|jgi:glycosyltransferase involved in cell wall biosynthesis
MDTNLNASKPATGAQAPLVTILVATYNRAHYIGEAVASAQKQTFQNWELIILDDASTDGTETIARDMAARDSRIAYVRHPQNKGIAGNRNAGLALAKGTYIAVLDSDDVWTAPTKLERQVAYLASNPACVAVGTQVSVIDENGARTGSISYETTDAGIRAHFLRRNQFAQSSIMYRLSAAQAVGGYDPAWTVNDDYDLWLKMGSQGTFANLSEEMAAYREHTGGITKTKRLKAAIEHLRIIKKHGKQYPNYVPALFKSYLRILRATI